MKIKTLAVAVLVSLFCMPAMAQKTKADDVQNKLNQEIYQKYFSQQGKPTQDNLQRLVIYFRAIPQLPKQTISDRSIQWFYTAQKFDKTSPASAGGKHGMKKISVTLQDIPGVTKNVEVVVVSPMEAISFGLTQQYQAQFNQEPTTYNPENYIKFYQQYKGTWLEKFVEETMYKEWMNKWYHKVGTAQYLHKIFALGNDVPLYKYLPKLSEEDEASFVRYAEEIKDYHTLHFFFDVLKKPTPHEIIERRVRDSFAHAKVTPANQGNQKGNNPTSQGKVTSTGK